MSKSEEVLNRESSDSTSRVCVPNKTVDIEGVLREKMLQLSRSKSGHMANVSKKYREFVHAVGQGSPTPKLADLLRDLVSAFGAFGLSCKRYNDVVSVADPSRLRECELQYSEIEDLVHRAQGMFDNQLSVSSYGDRCTGTEQISPQKMQEVSGNHPYEAETMNITTQQIRKDGKRYSQVSAHITPGDSISQVHTRASRSTTTSSARAKAAAKKAALQAKLQSHEKQEQLENELFAKELIRKGELIKLQVEMEREQRNNNMKRERLKIESDIHAAEAEENVLASFQGLQHPWGNIKPKLPEDTMPAYSDQHRDMNIASSVHQGTQVYVQGPAVHQYERSKLNPSAAPWIRSTPQPVPIKEDSGGIYMSPQNMFKFVRECLDKSEKSGQVSNQCLVGASTGQSTRGGHVVEPRQHEPEPDGSLTGAVGSERITTSEHNMAMQKQLIDIMSLPKTSITPFDGDPLSYWTFMISFDNSVHNTVVDDGAKLTCLLQFCKGKALKAIEPCAMMEPSEGYINARQRLKRRFGDEYRISEAWVRKLTQGPPIKPNNGDAIQELADDVRSCIAALQAMGMLDEIDSRSRMVSVLGRLPFFLQGRWRKVAVDVLDSTNKYPNIVRFADFLDKVARELTDPVFGSLDGRSREQDTTSRRQGAKAIRTKGSSFNIQTSESTAFTSTVKQEQMRARNRNPTKGAAASGNDNGTSSSSSSHKKCPVCGGNHVLTKCSTFSKMTAQKRLEAVKEGRLCYNCLDKTHRAYWCKKQSECGLEGCKMKHSKLLHYAFGALSKSNTGEHTSAARRNTPSDNTGGKPAATSFVCGLSQQSRIAMPIVPVLVRGQLQKNFIRTHALLDSGSNKTFCSRSLIERLGVSGSRSTLSLQTLNAERDSSAINVDLEITGILGKPKKRKVIKMSVLAVDQLPNLSKGLVSQVEVDQYQHLRGIKLPDPQRSDVMLIIGQDVPMAIKPLEVRSAGDDEPYAIRSELGWALNGPLGRHVADDDVVCAFVHARTDDYLEEQVARFWKVDTYDAQEVAEMSVDDSTVIQMWDKSVQLVEGHYQLPIPFRDDVPLLPDNRCMAERRLASLGKRLSKDPVLFSRYKSGIEDLLQKGYAEPVQIQESNPFVKWYLPHHNVVNRNKPNKLRIVFDCAAEFNSVSLNKKVLQGPDLTNSLLGVLMRFRSNSVGVMGDIEAMFHQVRVAPEHRNALSFLWWEHGDITGEPAVFRMTSHLFGGVWSPSCAAYALRRVAEDNKGQFPEDVITAVLENFYVDDCLLSTPDETSASLMVSQLCKLLGKGGFRLTKWVSNSHKVLMNIPESERAKPVKNVDLECGSTMSSERALGVQWDTETDQLGLQIKPREPVHTRRGLLSIMTSVYDPLGLVGPFVLVAKKIFQSECRIGKGWDEPLSSENHRQWLRWLQGLTLLSDFHVERCLIPQDFGMVVRREVHHFSDASEEAYGSVCYLRLVNGDGRVHCAFLLGKSRLAPMKALTIPRLELMGAFLAVTLDGIVRRELRVQIDQSVFWSDSTIVLQYICSRSRRFKTFVANRVAFIHEGSSPSQWRHVDTGRNPADDASRGLHAEEMISSIRWSKGPQFLWQDESNWPTAPHMISEIGPDDSEVKVCKQSCAVKVDELPEDLLDTLVGRYSCWYRLRKAVAWILKFVSWLKDHKPNNPSRLTVEDIHKAELCILFFVQRKNYRQEIKSLEAGRRVDKGSQIYNLEPWLQLGLLRVGGRLRDVSVPDETKFPIILPRDEHVAKLIVRCIHEVEARHSGKEYVLSRVRLRYWIPKVRPLVNQILRSCVICKLIRGMPSMQRMADLPVDRSMAYKPPFSFVGVDCFGPFYVKRGRSQEKRYGCLFTCMTIRAIHIEKLHSMDVDAFINAFVRFASRRGRPEVVYSDNGTNFRAGEKEMRDSIRKWNESHSTQEHLLFEAIKWSFNPPCASHMGGIWERQIRTVRKVMNAILRNQVLDDERLDTVFCEVEMVVNNRPLTCVSNDPKDPEPLTANHLLLQRSTGCVVPGKFHGLDVYGKRWRHVQLLADSFWKRWVKEYLPTLLLRQKWLEPCRNMVEGDIVLVCDEATPRNSWPLARVMSVSVGRDGLVRSAKIKTSSTVLVRPVSKLCLLEAVT